MKSFAHSRAALLVAALAAANSLVGYVQAEGVLEACDAISLSESDCGGSSCVMVFARVGERFRYELSPEQGEGLPAADCEVGRNAVGEKSCLPEGLLFNAEDSTLEGVPQRSGFHEFVVLRTEEGTTREQVVLIDIQGHAFGGGGVDYASYLAGGIH